MKEGYINFSLRFLGVEIISFHLEVDDFKTKWVLIAIATSALAVAAVPHIKEYI